MKWFSKKRLAIIAVGLVLVVGAGISPLLLSHSHSVLASDVYTSSSDGDITDVSTGGMTPWDDVHDDGTGDSVDDTGNYISAESTEDILNTDKYTIQRAFLFFDTSSLPDDCVVTAATLNIYVVTIRDEDSYSLQVQSGMPTYPTDPLATSDYGYTHYSGNGGSKTLATLSDDAWNSITLTPTGRGWINLTGNTKLCLRLSGDINDSPPTDNKENRVTFESSECGSNDAYLSITYVVLPTVDIYIESNITSTGVQLRGTISDTGGENCDYRGFDYGLTQPAYGSEWVAGPSSYGTGDYDSGSGITGLTPGTVYFYRAKAHNSAGWAYDSVPGYTKTFLTLPEAPTGFDVAVTTADQLDLTWAKGTGADTTVIRAKLNSYPTSIADGTEVYNDTGTSYDDTGLTPGDHWYYRAWSYCSEGGLSQYSSSYGQDNSVVLELPTVDVYTETNITSTGVQLRGTISDTGGENCDYRGFDYGLTNSYGSSWVAGPSSYGTGDYDSGSGITGLTPGTVYYYRAKAHNSFGWAYDGVPSYAKIFLTLPEPPTSFSAVVGGDGEVDLSWVKGTGADTTYIRGKIGSYPSNSSDGTLVYDDTGTSYPHTGLTGGDHWYYRTWSYAAESGLTQYSSTYDKDNVVALTLPTVDIYLESDITSTSVTLNGSVTDTGGENCDQRGFDYGLTNSYGSEWVDSGSFTSGDYDSGADITGLTPGTLYYYQAKAHNSVGWAYDPIPSYAKVFTTLPEDPADLTVTSLTDTSISLSWTPGMHATKSNLVWDTSDYPAAPNKNSPYYFDTGASTTVTGLDPGQIYYFRVWSWVSGSDVWSENYDEVADYTLPSAVTDFRITSPTNSSTVDLEWTKGTGGDTTMVRYLADSAPTDPTGVADGSVETYADTGSSCSVADLPGGHIYYFAAWAYDTDSTYYSTIVTASATPSASFTRYYSLSSDGTLYLTDADYADAQAPADGLGYVDSASTTIRVGQDYTTFYSVWRGVLMFTVDIPSNAVITAAQLGFYASSKTIDTNQFDFTIVSGSILNNPLVAGDYGALWYSNTSFGSMSTSLIGTSSYTYINLNANGIAAISRDGTTIFGLRSSLDIAGTPTPTDSEYIDIYSAESGYSHSPMLLVTYTIPPLGAPSNFGISYPQVFTGFTADGDQLYVFRTTVVYPFTPDQASYSAYNIQLLSADGTTVIAQVPLMMWGYRPASIYLNPDDALPWAGAYIIKIVQIADDSINTSVVLSTDNWIRSSGHMEKLDTWVEYTTIWMELKDGVDNGTYHTAASNQWLLSEQAASWFVAGVPGLDYVRTNLFLIPSALVPGGPDTTGTYASGLFSGHWGDYWSGIFDSLGDSVGIGGAWLASLVFLLIAIIAVYYVRRETNESPVAFAAALPVLGMGVLFGVPLYLVLIFGVAALFLMLRDMILARS